MPSSLSENDIPMVVYSLSQPIRSRILNYKKFVSQLDLDAFNNNLIPCRCSQYDHTFLNNERGHILTGNLKIIKNNKLVNYFQRVRNFGNLKKLILMQQRIL